MGADDTRLKVRLASGQVAAVCSMWTRTSCTVQIRGREYYELHLLDDLEPISEEEYRRAK